MIIISILYTRAELDCIVLAHRKSKQTDRSLY